MKKILITVFIVLFCSAISYAGMPKSTSGCHCFQERAFNSEKKFAADNYLLTTSFNSFIAVNFNLSKSQIVMMKMKGGIDPDMLLIALYIAREGAVDLDVVLAALVNGGTWEQIVESDSIQGSSQAKKVFAAIIATGGKHAEAAEVVIDDLLRNYFAMQDVDIVELRKEHANGRELVLVNILSQNSKRDSSPNEILIMHSRLGKSWGEIAHYFGFTPKETGSLLGDQPES